MLATLDELKRDGLAIVIVEQMVEDVVTGIADDVVVLEQGRVVLHDTPERISLDELERRQSLDVACSALRLVQRSG